MSAVRYQAPSGSHLLAKCASVMVLTCLTLASSLFQIDFSSSAGAAQAASATGYVAAANYFGSGNPYNMWSSDMSKAPQVFTRMKHDGFNTVALTIPWGQFQPSMEPIVYNQHEFSQLDQLISDAQKLNMGVVLRLSFLWDVDPADQQPWGARFNSLWSSQPVYAAWLDYITTIHQNVASYSNVRGAYLSWEDLWQPIFEGNAATTLPEQVSLATSSGYRPWLQSHYTLAQVSTTYGTKFTSWAQVPTPPPDKPSYALMFQYEDSALVNRLFLPAAQRFPGLTMEARVDVDPIFNGKRVVGSFPHPTQFQLPGTPVTGMYFSTYMGDPSSSHYESASDGLKAMKHTLSSMSSQSDGRPLFIYEYQFGRNSSPAITNPELAVDQIAPFIAGTEPLLKKYTAGYALWTYQDYTLSSIYNPSFSLGSSGWTLTGQAHAVSPTGAASYLAMSSGSSATQTLLEGPQATSPANVSLQVTATSPTRLHIQLGGGATKTISVTKGLHTYKVGVNPSAVPTLTVRTDGPVSVSNIQLYSSPTFGNTYSLSGTPETGAKALRAINKKLTAAQS